MSQKELEKMAKGIINHIDVLIKEKLEEMDKRIYNNKSDIENIKKQLERINVSRSVITP